MVPFKTHFYFCILGILIHFSLIKPCTSQNANSQNIRQIHCTFTATFPSNQDMQGNLWHRLSVRSAFLQIQWASMADVLHLNRYCLLECLVNVNELFYAALYQLLKTCFFFFRL